MGGSSFPRSPLNAKHLPKKKEIVMETETGSVNKKQFWQRQDVVCVFLPVKPLIHLVFFKYQLVLIFFLSLKLQGGKINSFLPPAVIPSSHRQLSTAKSQNYAKYQDGPIKKTRMSFRWRLSHFPGEMLICFCEGHQRKQSVKKVQVIDLHVEV